MNNDELIDKHIASNSACSEEWHELTAQQLVCYEALFSLLNDIQGKENISVIAGEVEKRWKYFANVAGWRFVINDEHDFLVIDGYRGQAKVKLIGEDKLSDWDKYHWKGCRPELITRAGSVQGKSPPEHLTEKNINQIQIIPIIQNNKQIAVLNISSRHKPFSPMDNKFIKMMGNYLADRIMSLMLQKRAIKILHEKATRDALTGILNRGAILEHLDSILALGKRASSPVSIVIGDIDLFKSVNDTYGHQTGDKIIRDVAARLKDAGRESDIIGRYGGEEFLIVLNDCGLDQVLSVSERYCRAISGKPFYLNEVDPDTIPITLSAGTASTDGMPGYNPTLLIREADKALYSSKNTGRNKVSISR